MRVGLVVSANKWTGAGAVADLCCQALHAADVDARLLFVGGRNLERRLAGRTWAEPDLVKERRLGVFRSNILAVDRLAGACDVVVCHLPHDHLLCAAAGVHRSIPLVRAFRNPRHIRRDPYHQFLNSRLSGASLAHSALEGELRRASKGLPVCAFPVPIEDRFRSADGSQWRTRLGIPFDVPVIGAVGKLAKGRGFGLLLETASRLLRPVHVVVVGHGERQPHLQATAARLGLESRVHWTGYQDEVLPELYSAMDVVLFTAPGSDWGHRSISEAQGCGRPVVAVDWPGVVDLVEDGVSGRVVDRDPDALARAVFSLINEEETSRRLGSAAASAAEKRRMAPVGRRLARFLESTLRG